MLWAGGLLHISIVCIYIFLNVPVRAIKLLLQHITSRLQLQNLSCFSTTHFFSVRSLKSRELMRATQVRWISGYCRRDISGQAVCYMFNMHTCASGMTRVNNISDFSFLERDSWGFFTCFWISAVLNSLESNRTVVAQGMGLQISRLWDQIPAWPLLGPWARPSLLSGINEINVKCCHFHFTKMLWVTESTKFHTCIDAWLINKLYLFIAQIRHSWMLYTCEREEKENVIC